MGYYFSVHICGELRIEKKLGKALKAARSVSKKHYRGPKKIKADWTLRDHVKLWKYECLIEDPKAEKKSPVSLQGGDGMAGLIAPHMDLWRALAPFIANTDEDYCLEFIGEDGGSHFRWYFVDGEIVEKHARIVWE